jgi:2-aminoadipate transaminase
VATVRSFSKVVAPGLRVGWSVLPAWLVDAVVVAKQGADLHTSTLSQHLVLELIGDEEAHRVRVAHVAAAYAAKAEALHTALMRHLGDALTVGAVDGGMFLWGAFADESVDTTMLLERALEHDVAFVPGAAFYAGLPAGDVPRHRIRMSFATLPVERFDEAARRLATAVHSQRAGG